MPKLSTEINLKFVQLYRDQECLWNAMIPSYKDKSKRDSALQKMCGELKTLGIEMTIKDVKNKIKNLRATYSQELTKIDKSTRSGAGSQEEYKSKLNWFQEMHSFIKNVPMKRKTTDSEESEKQIITENISDIIENSNDNVENSENLSALTSTSTSNETTQSNDSAAMSAETTAPFAKPSTKMSSAPAPKKKKIAQVATLVNEIRSIKNDLNSTPACGCDHNTISQQNEHDIFGAFLASQLKMLSPVHAITARDGINSVLSRCRMADLNLVNTTFSYEKASPDDSSNMTAGSTIQTFEGDANFTTTEYETLQEAVQTVEGDANFTTIEYEVQEAIQTVEIDANVTTTEYEVQEAIQTDQDDANFNLITTAFKRA